jgi:glycosyltransferase involved in cell wall biosynthesis
MTSKIRVLGLPSDLFGVGHYRMIWPLLMLQKKHSDEFEIEIRTPGHRIIESDLKKFDIIHYHRRINDQDSTLEWVRKCTSRGIKVICDIDDHWKPFVGHPAAAAVSSTNLINEIQKTIRHTPYITTTTEIFADMIRPLNKNIQILVNSVDTEQKQWQMRDRDEKDDRVRIAWIGGSSHKRDLDLLKGVFKTLYDDPDLKDKFQIVMCGFDTRGSVTEINPETKEQKTRKLKPHESVWFEFENIFSGGLGLDNKNYSRRKTLPITRYGEHYNHVDICLAPIDRHVFNKAKSELKVVETGLTQKALIASDVYIYNKILTNNENAILIDPSAGESAWVESIKQLILSSDKRSMLQSNLYELVKDKYDLNKAVDVRADYYRNLVKED